MRIIAGDYKGRRLQSPQDYSIRPTTDKVKEALFSILTVSYTHLDVYKRQITDRSSALISWRIRRN